MMQWSGSREELLASFKDKKAKPARKLAHDAYLFAKKAHEGQKRLSGEPYISHPVAVANPAHA